jgi:hypothetical protein
MSKKHVNVPVLMGVGLPTEWGGIPVTYLDGGTPVAVYVCGLHISEVSTSPDEPVPPMKISPNRRSQQ